MRWIKDQKVESKNRSLGIPFEVEKVPIKKMDLAEGLRRQARMIQKLDDNTVLILAQDMLKPEAAFPYCVFQKPPHGALMWPWSGNHRMAAFSLAFPEVEEVDAYVVCIKDPVMMDLYPRSINALESPLGFGKEERVAHARWMMDQHSISAKEVAEHFGIKVEWLYRANQVEEVRRIVADIPKANGLAMSLLTKLGPINNTNVMKATARLLCDYGVKGNEALQVIADIRQHSNELQMMSELGRWERILETRKVPKKRVKGAPEFSRSVRENFLRHLTGLAKLLEKHNTQERLQLTDPVDLSTAERAWVFIQKVMDSMTSKQNGRR